jgi:hypothetical protein
MSDKPPTVAGWASGQRPTHDGHWSEHTGTGHLILQEGGLGRRRYRPACNPNIQHLAIFAEQREGTMPDLAALYAEPAGSIRPCGRCLASRAKIKRLQDTWIARNRPWWGRR